MAGYNAAQSRTRNANRQQERDQNTRIAHAEAIQRAKRDEQFTRAENQIRGDELNRRQNIFQTEKRDLLNSNLASNQARMAASGIRDTSASLRAAQNRTTRQAEEAIRNNSYFANIERQRMELSNAQAAARTLSTKQGLTGQEANLVLAEAGGRQVQTLRGR